MAEEYLHDTIQKYLLGELPPLEREHLEANIDSDPALAEQVEIQRLAYMGLQRLAAADLRQKFDLWDDELDTPTLPQTPPPIQPNHDKLWIWTAVILLLLLLVGAFAHFWQVKHTRNSEKSEVAQRDSIIAVMRIEFQQKQDSMSVLLSLPKDSLSVLEIKRLQEEIDRKDKSLRDLESKRRAGKPLIALQYAQPSNTNTRGGSRGTDPVLTDEAKAFKAKEFAESIRLLKSIPANDSRQAEVIQRLPYSLFYASHFDAAIPAFIDLLEVDQFKEIDVQWHLLLCYVAIGERSETRYLLHAILKNPKHKYYQQAIDLKKALNIH